MSKVKVLIIAIVLLICEADAACYNIWKGDTLPNFTNSSYCRKQIIIQRALLNGQFLMMLLLIIKPEMLWHSACISRLTKMTTSLET